MNFTKLDEKKIRLWTTIIAMVATIVSVVVVLLCCRKGEEPPTSRMQDPEYKAVLDGLAAEKHKAQNAMLDAQDRLDEAIESGAASEEQIAQLKDALQKTKDDLEAVRKHATDVVGARIRKEAEDFNKFNMKGAK